MGEALQMDNGMIEDEYFTFERDYITYHFFFTPGRRTTQKYGVLAVDYGIRFDKESYKNERGTTTFPISRVHDKPQQKGYFEFTPETHPELVNAMEEDDRKEFRDLIVSEMNKHMNINESNELEQRAKKHKKKSKGMGWHMAVNAGDVEKGIEVFNNATSCNSGECSSMGEALEDKTFYYEGPVYLFDSIYKDVVKMYTDAPSREKALSNIRYRVCRELGRRGLKVKDEFLDEMPDNKETPTCDECGHPLNDMGQCPACEQGEEERYDDLTNLEALSKLRRMD
jgi:hypothetical protein